MGLEWPNGVVGARSRDSLLERQRVVAGQAAAAV